MDELIIADSRVKDLENLFINKTLYLMKLGYDNLLLENKFDQVNDIIDIVKLTRGVGLIYTGIDIAPQVAENIKVNEILVELSENRFKNTIKMLQDEFAHEMRKHPDKRNTTCSYQDEREKIFEEIIRENEERTLNVIYPSTSSRISGNSVEIMTQREEQLDELGRVVDKTLEVLNGISASTINTLTDTPNDTPTTSLLNMDHIGREIQEQEDILDSLSSKRSNATISSRSGSSNQQSSEKTQTMQLLNNISNKLGNEIKLIMKKLMEQSAAMTAMSQQQMVFTQFMNNLPNNNAGNATPSLLNVPTDSGVQNTPNSSDLFVTSNQFAHNIPLS